MKTGSFGGTASKLLMVCALLCGLCGANAAIITSPRASDTSAGNLNSVNLGLSQGITVVEALPTADGSQTPSIFDGSEVASFESDGSVESPSDRVHPDYTPLPEPGTVFAGGVALIAALGGVVRRRIAQR